MGFSISSKRHKQSGVNEIGGFETNHDAIPVPHDHHALHEQCTGIAVSYVVRYNRTLTAAFLPVGSHCACAHEVPDQ